MITQRTFTSHTRIDRMLLAYHTYGNTINDCNEYLTFHCDSHRETLELKLTDISNDSNTRYVFKGEIKHAVFGKSPCTGVIVYDKQGENTIEVTACGATFIEMYYKKYTFDLLEEEEKEEEEKSEH